jgi:nucleoside-diphosphate-sugar epimerase
MSERILVTGSDGFIGTALVPVLEQAGYEVAHFDLADGDISRDRLDFPSVTRVLHLAAKTFVPESWHDPVSFYQVNVMGTANVLEFCRRQGCSLTLMSSYLYGPPRFLPITEDHPIDPNTPYNHSKALVESLGEFYAAKFHLPVTILRPFNIFGPGQRAEFLIPAIVKQALDPAVEVIEVVDLEPRRDYLYLDDLARAILATLNSTRIHAIYNIGSGQSYSVEQVIQAVQAAAGTEKPYRAHGKRRPEEVMDTIADISRARTELGWEPIIPFSEGIRRVVADYRLKEKAV